jgi:hypothetical protein
MLRDRMCAVLGLGLVLLQPCVRGEDAPAKANLKAMPKIAARAAILKDVDTKDAEKVSERIRQFTQELMDAKEKAAKVELDALMKKMKEEDDARAAAERERRRRQENYDGSWGTLGKRASTERKAPVRVKLDFQVAEISTCRAVAEILRQHCALSKDIVEALPKLDHDGDGRLAVEEYRDAGAIVNVTARLFLSLDANGDGFITENELESARAVPANAAAAVKAGRPTSETLSYKLKEFDTDNDGVLDVNERKTMAMAYVDVSLRTEQEAAFYSRMADVLSTARQIVATKYENIEMNP